MDYYSTGLLHDPTENRRTEPRRPVKNPTNQERPRPTDENLVVKGQIAQVLASEIAIVAVHVHKLWWFDAQGPNLFFWPMMPHPEQFVVRETTIWWNVARIFMRLVKVT